MAITSRAVRDTTLFNNTTPASVGPGVYDLEKLYSIASTCSPNRGVRGYGGRVIQPKQVAFSSQLARNVLYYDLDDKPPPGTYYKEEYVPKVQVTHNAFRSTSSRLHEDHFTSHDTPGPGTYNVSKPLKQKKRNFNQFHRPYTAALAPEPGHDSQSHLHCVANPPSIPHGNMQYGYDQTPAGQLIPRQPPSSLTSLASQQSQSTSTLIRKNKGFSWSKSNSKRFTAPSTIYTGDIEEMKEIRKYERKKQRDKLRPKRRSRKPSLAKPRIQKLKSENDINQAQSSNKENNVPNYSNNITAQLPEQIQKLRDANKASRERFFAKIKRNRSNPATSVFASTSVRFEDVSKEIQELPGPGAYEVATDLKQNPSKRASRFVEVIRTQQQQSQKSKSIKSASKKKVKPEPGPGAYDIPSAFKSIDDIQTQSILLGRPPKPPFTSSEQRFEDSKIHSKQNEPGPQEYQSLEGNEMISSKFTDVSTTVMDAKTHERLLLTRLHNGYFTINYHRAPFGTHGSRFNKLIADNIKFPGPGTYKVKDEILRRHEKTGAQYSGGAKSVFKSKAQRNTYLTELIERNYPPPGTYEVSTSFEKLVAYKPSVSKSQQYTAPFSTSSQRIIGESRYALKTPGPGLYDIVKNDPNNTLYKMKTNTGYVKPEKQVPFASTAPRVSIADDVERIAELPGPGSYKTSTSFITKTFNKTYH